MTHDISLRVSTIRSQNPKGIGGCIFTGRAINGSGEVRDAKSYYVVRAPGRLLGEIRPQIGQWWQVSGNLQKYNRVLNGYRITEWQIDPTDMNLMLPSGEHIVALMAESEDFQGIGFVKARKLWDTFGEELYAILDKGDVSLLSTVLSEESARQAVEAWRLQGNARTLQWLEKNGFSISVGRKVLRYFGESTPDKIEEDPYRLLSFCGSWKQVDVLARNHFRIAIDDPRRLQGAVEEALYRIFNAGNTVASQAQVMDQLRSVFGAQTSDFQWTNLATAAMKNGSTNGSYVIGADGDVHPIGPLVMETAVARFIKSRLVLETCQSLFEPAKVNAILRDHERSEGISLNTEQHDAVQTAAGNAVALILGGAGVGKTTVLKALYKVYDEGKLRIFQMAVAGRAAKRMQEATGRTATTLASFLKNVKEEDLSGSAVVVVDEASMVDIITMHRLCEKLPKHVRIVLAGDPNQLMPIGPGLVLHALAGNPKIPQVELKVVRRFGETIANAASAIRRGSWPSLPRDRAADICFIPCRPNEIPDLLVDLVEEDPEDTQILSPRRNGVDGTLHMNEVCQSRFTKGSQPLLVWNEEFSTWSGTGFHLGDPLLCTRNLWNLGLQNGSLGRLVKIEDRATPIISEDGKNIGNAIAWADWDDGERRPILEDTLEDLELGYVITVHKAQGSQWRRVIVALTENKLLDRSLLYTAITRAQKQIIIVGEEQAAKSAVENLAKATCRNVAFGKIVTGKSLELGSHL